ncbi:NAD(P)-dependent oxidoreductase [Turneriella parva]|uniref:4-phosphoerythronate dehydrogenase n=1 Tax=Turneriella parva (strain ATCC BAA-1111 / DSM 21527 / NCTC 11395 / H) TaxID=869212 RepID=I4BBJ5_TURPD|nr:NAD(P)-dependent oxidoreductase [Turneriella parva]AFM14652.1 4-phosphoerythronate dehydrogenase [Turneriella parva DSM 21527]
MLILFQDGIPDIFFSALAQRGFTTARFSTATDKAARTFQENPSATAIFFRANFRLNAPLLDLLPQLKLAALVSTGADNVDAQALAQRGIRLTTGEGANARAVFDYVLQALCYGGFDFERDKLGVVGAGSIGSLLIGFFREIGAAVAHYDPFRAETGSLSEVLASDVVTFHVPLTAAGPHATQAMLNAEYFSKVQKPLQIIQASRGGIWNADFYAQLASHPQLKILAQDVYPQEPPHPRDLARARFSTPHIAGYSTRGRLGGIVKGLAALAPELAAAVAYPAGEAWFLENEAERFAAQPQLFNQLRDRYGWRKEFHEYNATEREAFLQKFPQLPQRVRARLFDF